MADGLPGGSIARGVLLRSDAPLHGDSQPAHVAWPPTTVIDLRHPIELEGEHPLSDVATVSLVTLVDPSRPDHIGPAVEDELRNFYGFLLEGPAVDGFVKAVDIVASADGPTLVHCLAGKDRTGVLVALLLRLVGIERDAVRDEYLLTNLAAAELLPRLRYHYERMDHRKASAELLTVNSIEAREVLIVDVMDHWDAHPGGTIAWFLDNGGREDTLVSLRERLGVSQASSRAALSTS